MARKGDSISLDDLLVFSASMIAADGHEVTFERLVAEAFTRFPERFQLFGYPAWPDSSRVNKSWLRCRTDFKYFEGSTKSGFKLTSRGASKADEVASLLGIDDRKAARARTIGSRANSREEAILRDLKRTKEFKIYQLKNTVELDEFSFCNAILSTPSSSFEARQESYTSLKGYASSAGDIEVLRFIELIANQYPHFLGYSTFPGSKPRGGMMRRRDK